MLGLGHIARRCRALNLDRAVALVAGALSDPHEYVRGHANSAACDLQMYLGVEIPGYDTAQTEELSNAIEMLRRLNEA